MSRRHGHRRKPCPSGKRRSRTLEESRLRQPVHTDTTYHYLCPFCKGWHWTHQAQ